MSKEFKTALIVESSTLTLSELTQRLQREPQAGSHDKGTIRGLPASAKRWDRTVWCQNARYPESPLIEQCSQLLSDMPPGYAELVYAERDDISIRLDIVFFFNTAYFNLKLPENLIKNLAAKGIDLEITAYPVDPDAGDSGDF